MKMGQRESQWAIRLGMVVNVSMNLGQLFSLLLNVRELCRHAM